MHALYVYDYTEHPVPKYNSTCTLLTPLYQVVYAKLRLKSLLPPQTKKKKISQVVLLPVCSVVDASNTSNTSRPLLSTSAPTLPCNRGTVPSVTMPPSPCTAPVPPCTKRLGSA